VSAASAPAPFDAMAADYDETFTHGAIGTLLRRALWKRYDAAFRAGMRVLDVGCGTGEDAVHLASRGVFVQGVDASQAMVARAEAKAAAVGLSSLARFRALPIESLGALHAERFEGAYSSFGPLNCEADLPAAGALLARLLLPGAPALVCLMGRHVPWEWAHYRAKGDARRAFRRLARGGRPWRGIVVRYPTPEEAERAFAGAFEVRSVWALGALVPPTYVETWAARHPRILALLDGIERPLAALPPLAALADHFVLEMRRKGPAS